MLPIHEGLSSQPQTVSASQKPSFKTNLIQSVTTTAFNELATSLTLNGLTCLFVASSSIPLLLTSSLVMVSVNTAVHSCAAFSQYRKYKQNPYALPNLNNGSPAKFANRFAAFNFAFINEAGFNTLIHESGHALAAKIVCLSPQVQIKVLPFEGGYTKFFFRLSPLGKKLGEKFSVLFITAMGPAMGIAFASLQIGAAQKIRKKYPNLSNYLTASGAMNVSSHVMYALSALPFENIPAGHDFARLWRVGNIHPAAAAVAMVALPVLVAFAARSDQTIVHNSPKREQFLCL